MIRTFTDLPLTPAMLKSIEGAGYHTPTPIQAQAIGPVLEGRDVIGCAQTGTGKTAAFAIPTIERLVASSGRAAGTLARVLVLAPTREAALAIEPRDFAHQAFQILRFAFTIAPIIAGLDKFTDRLVDWHQYIAPIVTNDIPLSVHAFMMTVGVVEVVAGLIVAFKPSVGGWIVAAWLWGIIINLLMIPGYYDIALRDFGLSLGAVALARLALRYEAGAGFAGD